MVNLNSEMADLWGALGAPAAGRARIIQTVAARRGEGTSTVARELAYFAARRAGRSVWLVDLDLLASPQHAAISEEAERYGLLGQPAAASPDGSMFFSVQPATQGADGQPWPDSRFLAAHRVGAARWWVTRFRREVLRGRQQVHIRPEGDYWNALRRFADLIIVDCPAVDRSQSAMTVAPFMDQTLMVVAADEPDVRAPALARDALTGAGADVVGLFFNRTTVEPPPFARGFIR